MTICSIKTSRCPYRAFGRHLRVQGIGRLVVSQMCYSVTLCQKVKKKLSKSWPKRKKSCHIVVKKLSHSCQKVVKKLQKVAKSCQKVIKKVVKKLSKSCQKVVKKVVKKVSVTLCHSVTLVTGVTLVTYCDTRED
jgi:nucleotidyltransferase/DNA polymerase involved in DNA repair